MGFQPASDLMYAPPNAVIVTYRSLLTGELLQGLTAGLPQMTKTKRVNGIKRFCHQGL